MSPVTSLASSLWSSLFAAWSSWQTRLDSVRRQDRPDRGATTLEYVIIAAIVCAAAVIVATLIVTAINGFGAKIPNT